MIMNLCYLAQAVSACLLLSHLSNGPPKLVYIPLNYAVVSKAGITQVDIIDIFLAYFLCHDGYTITSILPR